MQNNHPSKEVIKTNIINILDEINQNPILSTKLNKKSTNIIKKLLEKVYLCILFNIFIRITELNYVLYYIKELPFVSSLLNEQVIRKINTSIIKIMLNFNLYKYSNRDKYFFDNVNLLLKPYNLDIYQNYLKDFYKKKSSELTQYEKEELRDEIINKSKQNYLNWYSEIHSKDTLYNHNDNNSEEDDNKIPNSNSYIPVNDNKNNLKESYKDKQNAHYNYTEYIDTSNLTGEQLKIANKINKQAKYKNNVNQTYINDTNTIKFIMTHLTDIIKKNNYTDSEISLNLKDINIVWNMIYNECKNIKNNKYYKIIEILYLFKLFFPKLSYFTIFYTISLADKQNLYKTNISKLNIKDFIDEYNNIPSDKINKIYDNFFDLKIEKYTTLLKNLKNIHNFNKIPKFNILNLIYHLYKYALLYTGNTVIAYNKTLLSLIQHFNIKQTKINSHDYIPNNIHYYISADGIYLYLEETYKYPTNKKKIIDIINIIKKITKDNKIMFLSNGIHNYKLDKTLISKIITQWNNSDVFQSCLT